MSDRPAPTLFQFEHRCPDGKTVVLSDSPDGIGEYIYAPHLGSQFVDRMLTLDEFKALRPEAFEQPAAPVAVEVPTTSDVTEDDGD